MLLQILPCEERFIHVLHFLGLDRGVIIIDEYMIITIIIIHYIIITVIIITAYVFIAVLINL